MSTSQRVSRGFHRIGVFLSMFVLAVGLVLIISNVIRLRLWDIQLDELPMVFGGLVIGLIILGVACLSIYGLVRAIGWVIGGFIASRRFRPLKTARPSSADVRRSYNGCKGSDPSRENKNSPRVIRS